MAEETEERIEKRRWFETEIGNIIFILAGLLFVSSMFPYLRYLDVRRQKRQIEEGKQQKTMIRASDRSFPAMGYLSGAFLASILYDWYLAIVLGLILLVTILVYILMVWERNKEGETNGI